MQSSYVLSVSLPIIYVSIVFLREFESHYNPMAVQKVVPFRCPLLKQEMYLPIKIKIASLARVHMVVDP